MFRKTQDAESELRSSDLVYFRKQVYLGFGQDWIQMRRCVVFCSSYSQLVVSCVLVRRFDSARRLSASEVPIRMKPWWASISKKVSTWREIPLVDCLVSKVFTIYLPLGAKKSLIMDPNVQLKDILVKICRERGLELFGLVFGVDW